MTDDNDAEGDPAGENSGVSRRGLMAGGIGALGLGAAAAGTAGASNHLPDDGLIELGDNYAFYEDPSSGDLIVEHLPSGNLMRYDVSAGEWSFTPSVTNLIDSGEDSPAGGDRYQLPQASDSIDLQGQGAIEDASAITTDRLDIEETHVVTVASYGGSDIAEAFNNARNEHGFENVKYVIPANDWSAVSTTFNFADKPTGEPVLIDIQGDIIAQQTDGVVFDCTSSHNGLWVDCRGLRVRGGAGSTPDCCWLIARGSGGANVGINQLLGGTFGGSWNSAPWYNIGGEVWDVIDARFTNNLSSGRAAAVHYAQSNIDSITSPHSTAETGGTTQCSYQGCDFRPNGNAGHAVYVSNTRDFLVENAFMTAGSTDYIHFDVSEGAASGPYEFRDCRAEAGGTTPSTVIGATGPSSGANSIDNVTIPNGSFAGSANWFIDLPDRTYPFGWCIGSQTHGGDILRTQNDGIRFQDAQSNIGFWGFINEEQTGPISVTGDLRLNRWMFHGDVTALPKSAMGRCYIQDGRNGVSQYVYAGEAKLELDWTTGDIITRAASVTTGAGDADFT